MLYMACGVLLTSFTSGMNLKPEGVTFEGDIIFGATSGVLLEANLTWPRAEVFYTMDPAFSKGQVKQMNAAMEEIQEKTCVTFSYADDIHKEDYVKILRNENLGCDTWVGHQGGEQLMSLNDGCFSKRNLLHLLMHVLGFNHEHTRIDRDKYIDIVWSNVDKNRSSNFDLREREEPLLMETGYDYESVMQFEHHYCSRNGKPTMYSKEVGVELGGHDWLSDTDVIRINTFYECKGRKSRRPVKSSRSKTIETWLRFILLSNLLL